MHSKEGQDSGGTKPAESLHLTHLVKDTLDHLESYGAAAKQGMQQLAREANTELGKLGFTPGTHLDLEGDKGEIAGAAKTAGADGTKQSGNVNAEKSKGSTDAIDSARDLGKRNTAGVDGTIRSGNVDAEKSKGSTDAIDSALDRTKGNKDSGAVIDRGDAHLNDPLTTDKASSSVAGADIAKSGKPSAIEKSPEATTEGSSFDQPVAPGSDTTPHKLIKDQILKSLTPDERKKYDSEKSEYDRWKANIDYWADPSHGPVGILLPERPRTPFYDEVKERVKGAEQQILQQAKKGMSDDELKRLPDSFKSYDHWRAASREGLPPMTPEEKRMAERLMLPGVPMMDLYSRVAEETRRYLQSQQRGT